MQAPLCLWHPLCPTVGGLMEICEDSYHSLLQLAPELPRAHGALKATSPHGVDLYLQVLEQSRYTTLVRLTHAFSGGIGAGLNCLDPNARLCVYHDALQVEVLDLHQTALPIYRHYAHPALDAKWKANLFLARWLAYCVRQGYRFSPGIGGGADGVNILSSSDCQSV